MVSGVGFAGLLATGVVVLLLLPSFSVFAWSWDADPTVNDDKRIMAVRRRDHDRGDTPDDNSGIANFLDMVARTKV